MNTLQQKLFEVSGTFVKSGRQQKFSKIVSAHNEGFAKEKTYALFGSKMKIRRRQIKIEKVAVAKGEK